VGNEKKRKENEKKSLKKKYIYKQNKEKPSCKKELDNKLGSHCENK